jgi:hypothetical protein
MVWAVVGRDLRPVSHAIFRAGVESGASELRFRTLHRGLPRLLAYWRPRLIAGYEWRIDLNEFRHQERPGPAGGH